MRQFSIPSSDSHGQRRGLQERMEGGHCMASKSFRQIVLLALVFSLTTCGSSARAPGVTTGGNGGAMNDGGGAAGVGGSAGSACTWVDRTKGTSASGQLWASVASDSSGANLVAASTFDLWTSTDSGLQWSNRTSGTPASGKAAVAGGGNWISVASDSSGANLVAVQSEGGDIWTSTNAGLTWTNRTNGTPATGGDWEAVASDATGTNLVAVTGETAAAAIWTSTDSGRSWTNRTEGNVASGIGWSGVASDATGANLIALAGDIWTSHDAGLSWTNQTAGTTA